LGPGSGSRPVGGAASDGCCGCGSSPAEAEAASAIRFSVLRWRRSALLLDRFNLDEEEEDDAGLFFLPPLPLPLAGERPAAGGFIIVLESRTTRRQNKTEYKLSFKR